MIPPEETRGGENPGDWKCGTAAARAAWVMKYITETYGQPEDTKE